MSVGPASCRMQAKSKSGINDGQFGFNFNLFCLESALELGHGLQEAEAVSS